MTATSPVTGKFSAAKTAFILLFLLVVWLAFVAVPARKETVKRVLAEEDPFALKLRAVGLPNNPDLGGLPEIFAIWADKAEWKEGKTKFAYWHPGMKTYAYHFEATRVEGRIRFAGIPEPQESDYDQDESLGEDCPIRFYRLVDPKAPFVVRPPMIGNAHPDGLRPTVPKPSVETPAIEVPKPDLPSVYSQPKG